MWMWVHVGMCLLPSMWCVCVHAHYCICSVHIDMNTSVYVRLSLYLYNINYYIDICKPYYKNLSLCESVSTHAFVHVHM